MHELCNSYIVFLAHNFVFNYTRKNLLILFSHYSMLCKTYTWPFFYLFFICTNMFFHSMFLIFA